jgi:hypothetical protein
LPPGTRITDETRKAVFLTRKAAFFMGRMPGLRIMWPEKTKPTGGGGSGGLRYFVPAREEEFAGTTARSWEEEYDQADLLA